jgi:hypothetical protein
MTEDILHAYNGRCWDAQVAAEAMLLKAFSRNRVDSLAFF